MDSQNESSGRLSTCMDSQNESSEKPSTGIDSQNENSVRLSTPVDGYYFPDYYSQCRTLPLRRAGSGPAMSME